jgi:prolyl-tRNA editing enzyme YbaK/EbsC (Cys-tRNA(Pro) deacylase)
MAILKYTHRMEQILKNVSVLRAIAALEAAGIQTQIEVLSESARSAKEAADALGIEVGQIASSIVFRLPDDMPLLVITSGRHRVDTELVARNLNVEKLHRADADFIRLWSGYAIGGVSPLAWIQPVTVIIDEALNDYEVVWAAAGHPHAVFPTTYEELVRITNAKPMIVGE